MRMPDFFRARVMSQFGALADYVGWTEAQIQEGHHSTRAQILRENESPPDASEDSVQQCLAERDAEIWACDRQYTIDFRRILRFTTLMSVYTLVESNLFLLTQEIASRNRLMLDMGDMRANDLVERFKKFWTKVAHLPWWPDPNWEALKSIEELRNCIAHRNGVVRDNDGKIRQLLQRDLGVRLVGVDDRLADPAEAGTLDIEERFCREAVGQMVGLFEGIFNRAGCFGTD